MVFLKVQQVKDCCSFCYSLIRFVITGTGKTLSLLCASLAWLEQYKIHNSDSNGKGYFLMNLLIQLNVLIFRSTSSNHICFTYSFSASTSC